MDQVAKHNRDALARALNKFKEMVLREFDRQPGHFGRMTLEVFTQNGLLTGCETHSRETERFLKEKAAT